MKQWIAGWLLLMSSPVWGQSDTLVFENPLQLMQYAYSNTDFSQWSTPYFRNATMELEDSVFNKLVYPNQPVQCSGNGILDLFTLMNWWDRSQTFHRDSVLFPVYDHFYSLDEYGQLRIPFYVVDLKINALKPDVAQAFRTSSGADPYRKILPDDLVENNIQYASVFLDSFAYNNVILELNENTCFGNAERTLDFVEVQSRDETKILYFNSSIDLSDWLTGKQKLTFILHFSDQQQLVMTQEVEMNPRIVSKAFVHQNFIPQPTIYPDNYTISSIYSPDLKYSLFPACHDYKIRKPFIMVAGWGTHTDKGELSL